MRGIPTPERVDSGTYNRKAAPAGNRGLDTTSRSKDAVMPYSQSIHIPTSRTHHRDECGARSPRDRACNRPAEHTGRHLFARRHLDGLVREVWA